MAKGGFLNFFKRSNADFQQVDQLIGQSTFGGFISKAGTQVTPETAKKLSTYTACIRNISEDIGKQTFNVLRFDSKFNSTVDRSHRVYKLLNSRPNDFTTPMNFKQSLIRDALEYGNGYAFIERDEDGYPINLFNLNPLTTQVFIRNRKYYYLISEPKLGLYGYFTQDAIFHVRGMGDSYIGVSVLVYASNSLGKAIATQDAASEYFGGGGSINGLLELTNAKPGDEAAAAKVKESFLKSKQKDRLAVISGPVKYTPLNYNADESQLNETQENNVNDVCRWFRMPPEKVQKAGTVSNIEALNVEYWTDCLSPWQTRIEQECEIKLFDDREQQMYDVKCDNSDLLRGDTQSQERRARTMYHVSAWGANDVLRSMDMKTLGPEGERKYVPVNMIPSDMVEEFWKGKSQSNITEKSTDSTGSGAQNNQINE